ncbi:glycerol-3-phosphate acyltransferase [Alteromonadaceae bacterium Bs31]|nr:glycerol-3-phosphate acyltransferase [Alteromonadaceae bacterium Bs31]
MLDFEDIRPYNDNEVRPILDRLLSDGEFLDTVAKLKLPAVAGFAARALRGVVRSKLQKEVQGVNDVASFQTLVEKYLARSLAETVTDLSYSGLEQLDTDSSYLFISNHRDIAMDPAFVNWGLYHNGFSTLRIAIGDNLLTKPFASDLMRLNKSFIVKRSLNTRREKLQAAKKLSAYIHYSVLNDGENVWIAQREGRAKDGLDQTNPALINMLALSKSKDMSFAEYVQEARIVPVSISYALDPCDLAKARELYQMSAHGEYEKDQHEDVQSIALGITGFKDKVHVSFGSVLEQGYQDADAVSAEIDRQVEANFVLHPSHCIAYEFIEKRSPKVSVGKNAVDFSSQDWSLERQQFEARLEQCKEKWRPIFLEGYANPVYRRLGEK